MSFPRYPEYKNSGVEWLGEVPAHWKIHQLKRCVNGCVNGIWGSEPEPDNENTVVIRVADFDRQKQKIKEGEFTYRLIEEKEKSSRKLKKGDLLLEKSGGGEKTLVGQVVLFDLDIEAVTSNFVAKMTPIPGYSSQYLNYVFMHFYSSKINYCSIKQNTGIQNIDSDAYLAEIFCFPKIEDQEKITSFLDSETKKIDTLIAEQEQLIALLKEKRQAVISHAVTKGLDSKVKMKDSGIEWLGEVPGHWDVKRLKFLCKVQTGDKDTVNAVDDGEYPFFVRSQTVERINSYTADCEAVLTAGDGVGVGKVYHYINGRFDYHQRVYMMSRFSFVTGRFFFHYLSTMFQKVALDGGAKSTVDSLRMPIFMNFQFTAPPVNEQEEIIKKIDRVNSEFDELANEAARGIELLKERRSALISAAVTGKIDVTQMRREIA